MKFYLRILLLLMAAVLALSVFVGCDTGGDVGDDTDVDETNDPTSIFPDVEKIKSPSSKSKIGFDIYFASLV